MTYLEHLIAARTALLEKIAAGQFVTAYSIDGESYSVMSPTAALTELADLILREENRVSGRRDLRIVRGRWRGGRGFLIR